MSNLKSDHQKNMKINAKFMAFQNLLLNFFLNELLMWFFLQDLKSVFETHFQEPSTLGKVKIAMDTLAQHLELKNHNLSF